MGCKGIALHLPSACQLTMIAGGGKLPFFGAQVSEVAQFQTDVVGQVLAIVRDIQGEPRGR